MSGTGSRALSLLALLQERRFWAGADLSSRLGVSLRTLRRDVDRLRELGYPVRADPGVGGGYRLDPGASLPPLMLDDAEAVAVIVGLLLSSQSPIADTAETSARALAKVVPVLPARLHGRVEALRAATVSAESPWSSTIDPSTLVAVARACRDDERIAFAYTSADGAQTSRRVEPHRLVTLARRWYLVGYDLGRGDWRSFRLDRMSEVAGTGDRFRQRRLPGDADPAAFVRAGVHGRSEVVVVAELDRPAVEVHPRVGRWATVVALGDRCRVEVEASSLDWAVFLVGLSGARVISAEPPEFAALLRDWAGRLAG